MKGSQFVKNATQSALEPLETIKSQVAGPIFEEAANELGGFFRAKNNLRFGTQEIAREELKRARDEKKIKELEARNNEESNQKAQEVVSAIKETYRIEEIKTDKKQGELKEEVFQLQEEIAQLAKTAGVETKAHLQNNSKKVGILDIKLLRWIVNLLKIKAEESKSAQDLISQRSNAKRTTGMLAWVSGKQMKVHEQGTLILQG